MPDIVQPFAVVFEIPRAGDGPLAASQDLGERRQRILLPLILHLLVIYDLAPDLWIVAILDLFTGSDIT